MKTTGKLIVNADNNKTTLPGYRFSDYVVKAIPIAWWPVLATLLVQREILVNPEFMYDDFVHLYNIANVGFVDAVRLTVGGHLVHSFKTVVWLLKSLFGVNPFVFMLLAVTLHLASVRLLFEIISRLTAKDSLAAFGASLWGMSPFIAASLEWISVHGQVYATAAVLWVLLDVVRYSQAPSLLKNGLLIRHVFLLLVAATSYGTGLTSTVVFPLLIALWNPLPAQRGRLLVIYGSVASAVIAFYLYTMTLQADSHDNLVEKASVIRAGLDNISTTLGMLAGLLCVGSSGLLLGPLVIGKITLVPRESLETVATLTTVLATLPLLVWACVLSRPHERRRIFALLLVPCAAYGLIAIARISIMAQVMVVTPRYQYLATPFIAIVFCLILSRLIDLMPQKLLRYGRAAFVVWLALVIVPFAMAPSEGIKPIGKQNQKTQYKEAMREIRTALENSAGEDTVYIVNKPYNVFPWGYTPREFPGRAALFVLSYPSNIVDGKRVFFREESEEVVKMTQAQTGSRISELLVYTPKQVQ